jgi:hypothetical protein
MAHSNTQTVLFPALFQKPVHVTFDQDNSSSDGGAILLKAIDRRLALSDRLAACIEDIRETERVWHSVHDLLRQRIYGLACGYADCNDADRLRHDPVHKMILDRDPIEGEPLGSQPTLSRFENSVSNRDLARMGRQLAELVVSHHARRLRGKARLITIDLDPTDDPTHGQQQLSFFNGHYDTWCYLPVVGTIRFNDESEKYLFTAVLRPGNAPAAVGAVGILRRILRLLRESFGKTRIRVRLDGGFANPQLLDFLDDEAIEYVVAMGSNVRLEKRARRLMARARILSRQSGKTEHVFGETRYAARKWSRRRRIIIKAEIVRHPGRDPKNNARFVVTNLPHTPANVYQIYRERGDAENRIKELHHGLELDRTSCTSFRANQLRVLMTAAAYVLMQEMRRLAAGTCCDRAQVGTLRERLLKLGAWVQMSVRRIVLHLPSNFAWIKTWRRIALAAGALPG